MAKPPKFKVENQVIVVDCPKGYWWQPGDVGTIEQICEGHDNRWQYRIRFWEKESRGLSITEENQIELHENEIEKEISRYMQTDNQWF